MAFPFELQTIVLLVIGMVCAAGFVRVAPPRSLLAASLTGLPLLGVFLTQTFC